MKPLKTEHTDWQAWCYITVIDDGTTQPWKRRERISITSFTRESAITYVREQIKKWAWLNPKPPLIYVRRWVSRAQFPIGSCPMSILTGCMERALKAERELAAANKKILILRRAMSEGSLKQQRTIEELQADLNRRP